MKSTRKRTAKKRHPSVRDASPGKDLEGRTNSRKRKVDSDMLGPQWTEEELHRFYDAYRKYDRDYRKIATVVKNRNPTMVEALFTMNKAYLSLPEGTASVVGLVAMMQDYYSNLASDSEQESNDGVGTSRKPPKRAKGKSQPSNFKANDRHLLSDAPTTTSGYGLQSLLKKKRSGGSRPRAVGKRTPRFPIGYSRENVKGEKLFSPTQANLKLRATNNDDDLHEIALALTEASQRGGSPQVSHTPGRRTESVMSSPARKTEAKKATKVKHVESDIDEEEELEGSMEADTGELSGYNTYLKQSARVSNRLKERRYDGKKFDIYDTGDNHVDDTREACSGTEGQRLGVRYADARLSKPPSQGPRKKSKKALFKRDDEETALEALRILSDLSSMMHADANNDESTELIKDDHDDHVDEPEALENVNVPIAHRREKRRNSGQRIKIDESVDARLEQISNKVPKSGKVSNADPKGIPEVEEEVYQSKSSRKKPKMVPSKIRKSEGCPSGDIVEHQEAEPIDAGKFIKKKRSSQSASPKLTKDTDHSSSNDLKIDGCDSAQSNVPIPLVTQMNSQTRKRSKRKTYLKKPDASDLHFGEKLVNVVMPSASGTTSSVKSKLLNFLSRPLPRRWCAYEWFYNAIDYPWYAKKEFVEYLFHAGLGHVPRLARVEWSVIRSSLGKPRRFSQQFLKEEKEKLSKYRETVRTNYTQLREGVGEGLPVDFAKPLSVGQRVVAIHPKTREIHDGNVLTVDHSRCRVQFDRPDLGVEFVMDIDCMPLNPKDNLPAMHPSQFDAKAFENFSGLRMNEQPKVYMKILPSDNLENNGHPHVSPSTFHLTNHLKQTKMASEDANLQARLASRETPTYQSVAYSQPSAAAQVQAKEADVQVLANLNRSLDKKEALVSELKQMNDDVVENSSLKESETFKKQYAAVLVQLHDANDQVASALTSLRQRNTYPGTISVAPKPMGDSAVILSSLDRSNCQSPESGSQVNEIIESSRKKAGTMVDIALQAMSSLKGQENMLGKMEEAIEFVNRQLPLDDSASISAANDPETKFGSDNNEGAVPSELIAQCVATLLMIQKCTERQFPPAEVAQILDSAATSLKPRCLQNLPVYTDIQKCMLIVKNQILALIPT